MGDNYENRADMRFTYFPKASSFLGSAARPRPWPPSQNSAEFLGGFSTTLYFTG
jgi:hypothetical protein